MAKITSTTSRRVIFLVVVTLVFFIQSTSTSASASESLLDSDSDSEYENEKEYDYESELKVGNVSSHSNQSSISTEDYVDPELEEAGMGGTSFGGSGSSRKTNPGHSLVITVPRPSDSNWNWGDQLIKSSCDFKLSQNPCENLTFKIPKTSHGFFNLTPNFFIHSKNICVKNFTIQICGQESEITSASTFNSTINSDLHSDSDSSLNSSSASVDFFSSPTLQKCCPMDMFLTINKKQTADCFNLRTSPPWKPGNFEEINQSGIGTRIYPNYKVSPLACPSLNYIFPHQLEPKIKREKDSPINFKDIRVLENGGVETRESGNHEWKTLEQNTYCIDGVYYANLNLARGEIQNFMVLQCIPEESKSKKIKDTIFAVGVLISSFVLLMIVIVYGLVWNEQNIHGWTSGAFSLAMFLWFLLTGVRIWYKQVDGFCAFIAVATHFFRTLVFSWMFVMNFDLWSTISSNTAHSQHSKGGTRFLGYCCVALTIPAIVVTVSLIIENQFGLFDDRVIRPQYGRERCYLDHTALKAYAIYPTLILFLPNFLFIFLTIKFLVDNRKRSKKFIGTTTAAQNKKDRAQMILYVKLFIIMGISWIFEFISGLLDTDEVSWYWMITDIYNITQPFLLFWLFVCKKTIREQLSQKYTVFKAGFKWVDVHFSRSVSPSKTAPGSGQHESQSQVTASVSFTSRNENE